MSKGGDSCGEVVGGIVGWVVIIAICAGAANSCNKKPKPTPPPTPVIRPPAGTTPTPPTPGTPGTPTDPALEKELRQFADKHVPELSRVIDDIEEQIRKRRAKLGELAAVLRKLGVNPDQDADYVRWTRDVSDME